MIQSAQRATGRSRSHFADDIIAASAEIVAGIRGKRVLAVGGAGSIGSSTVHLIAEYGPKCLHILDQNENALAELVRQIRSRATPVDIEDFSTCPLDYGAAATRQFIAANGPYDLILNFAAIKHVRTEKDSFGILQMLDTNIVKQDRFRDWIGQLSPDADYFSVSTDKAANPVSFMGATKRVMEHVLFDRADTCGITGRISTARFANVAFSNGSLLQSFQNRMARGEPIACPENIRRYFVTLEESGQICLLASLKAPNAHIAIPRLDPEENLVLLSDIADAFIHEHGYTPEIIRDPAEATKSVEALRAEKRWPLLLTPADTAGEKPYEEFVGDGEVSVEIGMKNLMAVPYIGVSGAGDVVEVVRTLSETVATLDPSRNNKAWLKSLIGELEPAFMDQHIDSNRNLDQRA